MFHDRKSSFKAPPATTTNQSLSQELRRNKALAEQKRRRAQKVELCRQLDLFANLNLGPSDEEEDDNPSSKDSPDGVSPFTPLLHTKLAENSPEEVLVVDSDRKQSNRKGRAKHRRRAASESKWANNCMYAELLEMKDVDGRSISVDGTIDDGLPRDLETGWVAVAPVPVGKRCLAVTYPTCGLAGSAPNTALRSRVQGKSLIPPFPSPLPPSTILDCILDASWRDNGILHVLDIIQYKGQNVGDCETAFRFWWRDTRLAELPRFSPPTGSHRQLTRSDHNPDNTLPSSQPASDAESKRYRFPYPNTLLPVPYHTNTTFRHLISHVIPLARSSRSVPVEVPVLICDGLSNAEDGMDADTDLLPSHHSPTELAPRVVDVGADGLLLYVAEASYEPGTSPLSSWIPIIGHAPHANHSLDLFERLVCQRITRLQRLVPSESDMEVETKEELSIP